MHSLPPTPKVMRGYVFAGVGRYINRYVCEQLPGASSSRLSPNFISHILGVRRLNFGRSRSVGEVCTLLSPSSLFSFLSTKPAESFSTLSFQRCQDTFLYSFWVSSFHSRTLLQATPVLSLVVSSLKSVCCDFFIFYAVMPRSPARLTWYGILSYSHHLL